MRILQISSSTNFGGGERHLVDLARGLAANGNDVFLAVRPHCEWLERIDFLHEERIFKVSLKNSLDVFSARRLAEIIRRNEIEIVHAHLARDYAVASLAVRMARRGKLILTRHVLFPINRMQRLTLGNVSKVIAVSGAVSEGLERIFPPEKIVRIYNGIDAAKFSDANCENLRRDFRFENNIAFDAPFIGTIGELKELKGQRDFVLAANEIVKKFPDAHFAIIGKDNSIKKDFRRELKRLVKVFGLENKFLWLDWVEDTARILSALDVFVSASHSESFGLAILEAMANGTAIVASETRGATELLQNDFSGKLVQTKNPVAIAEAVCSVLENKNLQMKLSANARKSACENFGLDKMIAQTSEVYRTVLK